MVCEMIAKNSDLSWAMFCLLTILTSLVYEFGWAADNYQIYLSLLGIASLISATWLLFTVRLNWFSVLLVLIGLLAGQWWFAQGVLMRASWLFNGFV
jgi:hypothetical protein